MILFESYSNCACQDRLIIYNLKIYLDSRRTVSSGDSLLAHESVLETCIPWVDFTLHFLGVEHILVKSTRHCQSSRAHPCFRTSNRVHIRSRTHSGRSAQGNSLRCRRPDCEGETPVHTSTSTMKLTACMFSNLACKESSYLFCCRVAAPYT